uniref:Microtubule-actin cross-linking factor 1 n=1 Tax=Romanomermis culicivorax TaxID=13658 RepID=A0A915IN52_ROMCU
YKIFFRLIDDHISFEQRLSAKQADIEEVTKGRRKADKIENMESSIVGRLKMATPPTARRAVALGKNSNVQRVSEKWSTVWLAAMGRKTKLTDLADRLRELHRLRDFDFDDWRKRYMNWMNHKKSRVMDFFRRQDADNDGKVTRMEFIDGIIASKFPTTRLEMEKVADIFDKNRDGYIDYREFVAALKTSDKEKFNENPRVQIEQEVQRQMQMCTCNQKYKIQEVSEGKYKFGEQLRLVRILRSTVMVRVGGGWVALDEFLVKNDPCRAKGRTNIELRERFILPDGASQTMTWFRSKTPRTSQSGGACGSQQGSSGSSAGSSSAGHCHAQGPIMKIREKTERSLPMSKHYRSPYSAGALSRTDKSSSKGSLMAEKTPSTELLSPPEQTNASNRNGFSISTSRSSSRVGSEIPVLVSRPHSRAGSDMSDISLQSKDSLAGGTSTPSSKIPPLSRKRLVKRS